jgi:hypothetical protein
MSTQQPPISSSATLVRSWASHIGIPIKHSRRRAL